MLVLKGIAQGDSADLAEYFGKGTLIRSETVYATVLLALLLPAALIVLTVLVLRSGKRFLPGMTRKRGGNGVRFHALCDIDKEMKKYVAPTYDTQITLEKICEDFREFAASRRNLYYEEEDIRKFVAGFAVSHLMIMQGLSGTGKTSLATVFGEYLNNPSMVLSVQPMWKERADMMGYFNEFTKQFCESALLKKLYEARYTDEIYVIVLDEMNIARVEYYFADFLSLMELDPSNRYLDMTSDSWKKDPKLFENGRFRLPSNVWFIGTANNDDSTFAISDKVYDRAMVMNLNQKAVPFSGRHSDGTRISATYFSKLVQDALSRYGISQDNREKMEAVDRYLLETFHITHGNRIRRQMQQFVAVYLACGGTEEEALDDFLVKKVLRRLEGQNPVVIAKASKGLSVKLEELFGENAMPLSQNYLHFLRQMAS